jgi:hypothetical protein
MMVEQRETIETAGWTDRELMLRTYYQTVETNGTVSKLRGVVYGDPIQGIVGLVEQACENTAYRVRAKSTLKIIVAVASAALTMLTAMVVMLVEHVL